MGSTEFQKELISYLEEQNDKLRNKVAQMKEIMEKVLTKDTTKNDLESAVYDLVNVCCAMTDEIDEFYEHFSATSAALCSVLKRKSQMVQLSKKLSGILHSVEQIDPELELIDASNMACFAKRLSDGKSSNQKRGTAKVSPMINGLTITTAPRIRLNRVTQEITNRHRIITEAPRLSPVVEMSPATTPPRNPRHILFRQIQISVPRLNINSDGQVINRNNEESPRSSNCVKRKKPLATRLSNNSQQNRRSSELPVTPEEENEELATEEEKENVNNKRNSSSDEVLRAVPGRGNSDGEEEDETEEQNSQSSAAESSPESSKEKNKSLSSPEEEQFDPLEGPSWLLDERQSRRESGQGSSFKYVNVRRQRNRFFSGSSKDDSVENQKLETVAEQKEPDEIDPRQEEENVKEKKIDLSSHDNLDTSDMEMTECLPVARLVNHQINKILPSHEKVATPITDSSTEINSSLAKSETSLNVTQRKRIEESSEEEDEENNITTAATYGSDGFKLGTSSSNSANLEDLSNINDRTLKVVIEKRESIASLARTDSVKSSPSPKNSTKEGPPSETKIIDLKKLKSNVNTDRSSPHSPEKVEKAGSTNTTPLAPENQGRPKRGAALRCMEQKVWILGSPDDEKNKNKNKNKNFKSKRKQGDDADSSPNEKKKKNQSSKKDKKDESNIDSDTSTQDSVLSSPPPQNIRNGRTPNIENNRAEEQRLARNTSPVPADEGKKKRKFGPFSSKFSSIDETNRTMDQSNVNNGSNVVVEEEGRRKRRAAPGSLKEPSLNQKLRRNP